MGFEHCAKYFHDCDRNWIQFFPVVVEALGGWKNDVTYNPYPFLSIMFSLCNHNHVSDYTGHDELKIVSEHIVPAKTSLELLPVEVRRLLDQLDLDPNVMVKIRVSSTGGGGISRGLMGMGK